MNENNDRRTPVLNGEVFCSPACGYGCKKKDYDLAVERAAALVKSLGVPWVPKVWESGKWHSGAFIVGEEHARQVLCYPNGTYWVSLVFAGIGQLYGTYDDPVAGVNDCITRAKKKIADASYDIARLEGKSCGS